MQDETKLKHISNTSYIFAHVVCKTMWEIEKNEKNDVITGPIWHQINFKWHTLLQ